MSSSPELCVKTHEGDEIPISEVEAVVEPGIETQTVWRVYLVTSLEGEEISRLLVTFTKKKEAEAIASFLNDRPALLAAAWEDCDGE